MQTADSSNTSANGGMSYTVEQVGQQLIREALTSAMRNIVKAAENLKITERMIGTSLKKMESMPGAIRYESNDMRFRKISLLLTVEMLKKAV